MAVINTMEDLIRLLDENPKWVEALRVRLLTCELIELPEKFAEFVKVTNDRFDKLEGKHDKLERRFDKLEKRFDELEKRFDKLEKRFDELERRFDELERRFDELERRFDELERRFDKLESQVQSLQDDVGMLKGAHARSAAIRDASSIAREMNFYRTKNLSQDDLWVLIDRADTVDIPKNALRSFRHADLIMEATDQDGETCYIAVEISFTVNGRDTTRALRNAEFLTRFTGKPAHAAVVGLRRDDRIHDLIKRGEVFWYQLDPEIMDVE